MKQLQIVPQIYSFETFSEFDRKFHISKKDLIISSRHIFDPILENNMLECSVLYHEDYGKGEPDDTMVNGILKAVSGNRYDRIIVVGGGSVIDIGKIVAVADGECDVDKLYEKMLRLSSASELIIIPTTCGTGSEMTNISIVNRTKLNAKQGLVSEAMYAKYAILISEFMESLPYKVFATSSIDALIHAVESYLSPLATPYTEMYSIEAIRMILSGYRKVAEDKDNYKKLGEKFLLASNYAGIAFGNAGCGTIHAMSYAFGGKYHVAHGESNYQFFIPVLEFYKEEKPEGKIAELERLLKEVLDSNDGFATLKELLENILRHKPMSEYGASEEDLMSFSTGTICNQQRLLSRSYVPMGIESIYRIFKNCL